MDLVRRLPLPLLRVLLGAAVGLAWGHGTALLALLPLVVGLWWQARTRLEAFAIVLAYQTVSARSLIVGATRFLDVSSLTALAVVLAPSGLVACAWAFFWRNPKHEERWRRSVGRILAVLVLTHAPGLGAVAVASPLQAAGVWFPGLGWLGLGLMLACLVALRRLGMWPAHGAWALIAMAFRSPAQAQAPLALEAVATSVEVARSELDFERQWQVAHAAQAALERADGKLVVLPESVGGLWQEPMERMWAALSRTLAAQQRAALVGAILPRSDGDFESGAVLLGAAAAEPYRQRFALPVAMWRPWARGSYQAHWFGPGTLEVLGQRIGVLVCFEVVLPWPVLASVAEGAEALVALSNGQWLRGTGGIEAQRQSLESWGALFALPVVHAVNEGEIR